MGNQTSFTASRPPVVKSIRVAAVLYVAAGLGFGAGGLVTLPYFARTGRLPMTPFGFRAYSGPFEQLGASWFTALLWALVGICALDTLAGIWLWHGRRRGAALGGATTPLTIALGIGFALPFLLAAIPIRLALTWVGRKALDGPGHDDSSTEHPPGHPS